MKFSYPLCNTSRMSGTTTLCTNPTRHWILQQFLHIHIYQIWNTTRYLSTLLHFLPWTKNKNDQITKIFFPLKKMTNFIALLLWILDLIKQKIKIFLEEEKGKGK